ncbi:MAG: hypothetical protein IJT97_04765 [Bacteroidaceae bacterium]|nr:hypothetical protein [Bacteroidaceae bacterium]
MADYSILPPMADFRRTLYWNPDITTDRCGKARVEFYNNSTCTDMLISIEACLPTDTCCVIRKNKNSRTQNRKTVQPQNRKPQNFLKKNEYCCSYCILVVTLQGKTTDS